MNVKNVVVLKYVHITKLNIGVKTVKGVLIVYIRREKNIVLNVGDRHYVSTKFQRIDVNNVTDLKFANIIKKDIYVLIVRGLEFVYIKNKKNLVKIVIFRVICQI